jgi:outer membrane protein assembly factor BamE (lipoprotein component of BamABCDE complex)
MKYMIVAAVSLMVLSACSTKEKVLSDSEYQRVNVVSEKAFDKLDRE